MSPARCCDGDAFWAAAAETERYYQSCCEKRRFHSIPPVYFSLSFSALPDPRDALEPFLAISLD
jgi:hypothetical protein